MHSPSPQHRSSRLLERSLRQLLVATILLPVLVFAGAAVVSYRSHFSDARERLGRFLDVVHEHAVKVFETHELTAAQTNSIVDGLADEEIVARQGELNPRLRALVNSLDQISDIWVLDADGRPLITSNFLPAPRGLDLSDRNYFRVHRDGRQPPDRAYVSTILRGRADPSQRFFQLSTRREREGVFAGVTAVSIDPAYFETFYAQAARGEFDSVALVRSDGAILSRFPYSDTLPEKLEERTAFMRSVAAERAGGLFESRSTFDGVPRMIAYRRLPEHDVYVAVGLDRARVLHAWQSALAGHLVYGLPATLGLVGLTLLALRRARSEADALDALAAEMQRRAEIEEQLRQSQKMEAVGRLTGGIAHDFNNLLQVTVGSLDMLRRRLDGGDERSRALLQTALDSVNRASSLTRRLLAFARRQPLEPRTLDANAMVRDMLELLRRTLGETIEVRAALAENLWLARIDPHQLESAVVNLAVNARDSMPEGGTLTIATANEEIGEAAAARLGQTAGQYVLVSVADTGSGMSPEVLSKAFEPFFTTKPAGQGTGLGLSQVYGFVKQSGGHVAIDSARGKGTTVRLYLPRSQGARPHRAEPEEHAPMAPRAGLTVLVVEDEADVRRFVRDALGELGYQVVEADRAAAALDLLDRLPDVRLLLTDIVMPDMNGRQLAELARRRRPALKVLYMTGYIRDPAGDGEPEPGTRLIVKPFTLAQLASKIDTCLDEPRRDPAPPGAAGARPLRVLVVDDDPLIAMSLAGMLQDEGHEAIEVTSAEAALRHMAAHGADVDVVMTDESMPGMSGSALAAELRRRRPDLPVVIASGYSSGHDPGLPHLTKPFTQRQLREVLASLARDS